jgi:hypothetical protein
MPKPAGADSEDIDLGSVICYERNTSEKMRHSIRLTNLNRITARVRESGCVVRNSGIGGWSNVNLEEGPAVHQILLHHWGCDRERRCGEALARKGRTPPYDRPLGGSI